MGYRRSPHEAQDESMSRGAKRVENYGMHSVVVNVNVPTLPRLAKPSCQQLLPPGSSFDDKRPELVAPEHALQLASAAR